MASKERQSVLFTSELLCDSNNNYHSLVFQDSNMMSMSPNGPLSDLNDAASSSNYSTSPLDSEMGLPETDEVILAELTRRMAEFTFKDEDGKDDDLVDVPSAKTAADSFSQENYEINNKQQVRKEGSSESGGRRVKTAEQKEHRRSNMQDRKAWKSTSSGSFPDVPSPACGSGKRAVFLGGSKMNSVSTGTGVFLPSATNSRAHTQKKPAGCSTVIIPARVLQTLQQHFNNVGAKSHSQNSDTSINQHWQNDVLARINRLLSQQQEQAVFQIHPPATTVHDQEELRLPHEWTY